MFPPAAQTPPVNILTVDVEDYFQVSAFERIVSRAHWASWPSRVTANTERVLALFDEAGVRGTFFVLGWVAEKFPGLVRRIADCGHEVASHGYAHRLVYEQTPREFRDDLRRARFAIESVTNQPVFGYRAPSFSITRQSWWAFDVLIEEGYIYDASVYPVHHDRYGVPDAPRHPHWIERPLGRLREIPGSTVRLGRMNVPFGGGGYFRLAPYAVTEWAMRRVNTVEQQSAVFYIHPWEFDPDQPRLPAPAVSRFRHYHNLKTTEDRLRRLLAAFRFGPVSTVLADTPAPVHGHGVPALLSTY
jgi:polysaccharide deacetylase family protein (PEP-CTERM system associated)